MLIYPGLAPSNVNKDAKYSVVHSRQGGMEVRLVYRVSSREKQLLTNDRHEKLVAMVNHVKEEVNGLPGGAFYINEYGDVLVPHPNGGCVFAGSYDEFLKFDFDGQEIGPVPSPDLAPGDQWLGPHVGIPYVLTAGASDFRYEVISGQRSREYRLSDVVGQSAARLLARRLATVKGYAGGRVYINEARHFFAPVGSSYLYLGPLGDEPWFPAPAVPGTR
ncbi:hypothetical protein [Micromonospora sp. NBRC 101691]|uniref:hypothetical protein n=1 Tax=Micromonospora sp. NBRC 101691 TaxID=3032198 RepID=UPI0024A09AC9|nr:hypothetical protein [Micromonospora sp. NBRC 101691]GLY21814.1 hypothetical protein Misp04_15460 [Micromonospora sp. NBRC 101691]